jgi:hypothetical protein
MNFDFFKREIGAKNQFIAFSLKKPLKDFLRKDIN